MPSPLHAPSFDDLPELTQGGIADMRVGAPGIKPEVFAQALQDGGIPILGTPPVQQAPMAPPAPTPPLEAVLAPAPAAQPPYMQQPMAPARQDTPQQPMMGAPAMSPQVPGQPEDLTTKLQRIREKYGDDPARMAQAYLHSVQQGTRAGMENSALRGELGQVYGRLGQIETLLRERIAGPPPVHPGYPPQPPGYSYSGAPPNPVPQGAAAQPNGQAEDEFFRNPVGTMLPPFEAAVQRAVRQEMQVLGATFREQNEAQRQQDALRNFITDNRARIEALEPIMNQIYSERPHVYSALPPAERVDMLVRQAEDRVRAWQGQQLYREVGELYGANGGAITAPPGSGGGLPVGMGRAAVPPQAQGWSNTPEMRRIWGAPSGSLEEDEALRDVLRQRGFHSQA